MVVVLDTCALLWLTLSPDELSPGAHRAIAESSEVLVSSISIWEIGIKAKRKKLTLGTSFPDYVERLSSVGDLRIVAIDHNLWAQSVMLEWDHRDPADRVIVSLAQRNNARIITDDSAIKVFYKNTIG